MLRDIRWHSVAATLLQGFGLLALLYALMADGLPARQWWGVVAVAGVLQLAALVSVLTAHLDER